MMKKRASSNIINPMVPWSGALLLGQGFNAYIRLVTIILTDYFFYLMKSIDLCHSMLCCNF